MKEIQTLLTNRFFTKVLLFISLFFLRFLTSGGAKFNNRLWDLELTMFIELKEHNFFEYLLAPDTFGYLIIPIRFIVWLVSFLIPESHWAIAVRSIVISLQIVCFYFSCKITLGILNKRLQLAALICLMLIPMEDLNYLHHVGYLFYFPSIYLLTKISSFTFRLQILTFLLIVLIQNKPLTTCLLTLFVITQILLRIRLRNLSAGFITRSILLIASFASYLVAYMLLPRTNELPLLNPLVNLSKALINFGFLVSVEILPAFSIGFIGLLRMYDKPALINITGIVLSILGSLMFLSVLTRLRTISKSFSLTQKHMAILLAPQFIASYFMVYTIGNFYWITTSPLWNLSIPSHVWMRWSAIFAVYCLLFIVFVVVYSPSTSDNLQKNLSLSKAFFKRLFFPTLIMQYLILWFLGNFYLQRWWSF